MPIPDEWRQHRDMNSLCRILKCTPVTWKEAIAESRFNYVEETRPNRRTGKSRDLCYPPRRSTLRAIQTAIKDRILVRIDLAFPIRGYLKGFHNINVAAIVCGHKHVGKVDITKFHPSISTRHVVVALRKHGLSWEWSRQIARLVTYRGSVPQGAPTSNHIANIVLDTIMRRTILPFSSSRGIVVDNYGDDLAFGGGRETAVRRCVRKAKRAITRAGFEPNDKCRESEHRGAGRVFLGCATGRDVPDYPRQKYLDFRKELRQILWNLKSHNEGEPISIQDLSSIRHRINYVKRLNRAKARRLIDTYYRIRAERRRLLARALSSNTESDLFSA